jgi:hypothetical protein
MRGAPVYGPLGMGGIVRKGYILRTRGTDKEEQRSCGRHYRQPSQTAHDPSIHGPAERAATTMSNITCKKKRLATQGKRHCP